MIPRCIVLIFGGLRYGLMSPRSTLIGIAEAAEAELGKKKKILAIVE